MAGRRDLSFANLGEVMPDVERLMAGCETVGSWSLGQICNHLAMALRYSLDGFPVRAPWLVRQTLGRRARKQVFETGRLAEGVKVPEAVLPKPGLDDRAEAEGLRQALARFEAFAGPCAPHPFFGTLTRDEWARLHCIHCAHHLSFARPAVLA